MSSTLTPNMSLIVPTVGSETGPTYAQDINNSLTILDAHNHSNGSGVQINPSGININSALAFNGNSATSLASATFLLSTTASTTAQSLYVHNGTESPALPDLWYYDGANQVQITSGGQVNATIASLPGQSYAAGVFSWKQGTGSTTPANFDIGSIVIRPDTAGTVNGVTLAPNSGLSSAFTLFLPAALPSSPMFVTLDNLGNIGTASNIGALQLASGVITQGLLAGKASGTSVGAGGVGIAPQTPSTFSQNGGTAISPFASMSVTITTTGRPVMVILGPAPQALTSAQLSGVGFTQTVTPDQCEVFLAVSNGTNFVVSSSLFITANVVPANSEVFFPFSIQGLDFPSAGTYTYSVYLNYSSPNHSVTVNIQELQLIAYEI